MNDSIRENPAVPTPRRTNDFFFPPTSRIDEKFLIFTIDEELFAVSAGNVAEAVFATAVAVLPNAPVWLSGIANLRGEIVPVINLSKILEKHSSNYPAKTRFIVLRSSFFERGFIVPADAVNEIVCVSRADIQFNADKKSPHVFGRTFYQSKTLNLLDTEKLLAALEI